MDARLDPECQSAIALVKGHEDQDELLLGGNGGQLAAILHATQEKQINDHLIRCARCRHYDPRCPACGFDARREKHGWRCAKSPTRFSDLFPWNWRATKAPQATVAWRYVNAPRPSPAPRGPDAPSPRTVEVTRPVRVETGPKPRARPAARPADSLAVAYAALGVSMEADADAVRAAYRSRAQQYHPDKVAHMAPEFRDVAAKKMVEINAAYERIKRTWT